MGKFRWSFPVYSYEHRDATHTYIKLIKSLELGWPWLNGGVFVSNEMKLHLFRGLNPPRPPKPPKPRKITQDDAARVFTEATAVDCDDVDALLAFVNSVGLLGCAVPTLEVQTYDSVKLTTLCLKKVQRLAKRLETLKQRKEPRNKAERQKIARQWRPLLKELRDELHKRPQQPSLEFGGREVGGVQVWRPRCLEDVLFLTLWQVATATDYQPRQCEHCEGMFFVRHSNERKRFCSKKCKNAASVARYRDKQRRS